jgi:hypothetical protein
LERKRTLVYFLTVYQVTGAGNRRRVEEGGREEGWKGGRVEG